MAESRLDIVLFGATGYTGKSCIEYIHKLLNGKRITWGIAGRSESKLKQTLADYQKTTADNLSNVPIMVADLNDYGTLTKMTARAKVLLNCCGPYRFYGEPVVKACIETGTHQVDVCGEPQYMESIQLKYHKLAQEKGVYIVSACGFDSIPSDLGLIYATKQFGGTLNTAETYMQFQIPGSTSYINYGTWESLIHSYTHAHELKEVRRKLYPIPLPKFLPQLEHREFIHQCDITNTWNIPFPSADRSVVMRTQRYLFEEKKLRPIQVQYYLGFKSRFWLRVFLIYGCIFQFFVKYEFGRKLLLKHPKLFSMGLFSHEGPTKQASQSSSFSITISGKGWKEKLSEPGDSYSTPPSEGIVCRISGYDPGYGATAKFATLSAAIVLEESHKFPQSGGVYTPGAAFYDTSLISKLQNHFTFEVISKN